MVAAVGREAVQTAAGGPAGGRLGSGAPPGRRGGVWSLSNWNYWPRWDFFWLDNLLVVFVSGTDFLRWDGRNFGLRPTQICFTTRTYVDFLVRGTQNRCLKHFMGEPVRTALHGITIPVLLTCVTPMIICPNRPTSA